MTGTTQILFHQTYFAPALEAKTSRIQGVGDHR
jgi:hypothetical protein